VHCMIQHCKAAIEGVQFYHFMAVFLCHYWTVCSQKKNWLLAHHFGDYHSGEYSSSSLADGTMRGTEHVGAECRYLKGVTSKC
jgi:hypothetical protein